jgi:hypothetical protein
MQIHRSLAEVREVSKSLKKKRLVWGGLKKTKSSHTLELSTWPSVVCTVLGFVVVGTENYYCMHVVKVCDLYSIEDVTDPKSNAMNAAQ